MYVVESVPHPFRGGGVWDAVQVGGRSTARAWIDEFGVTYPQVRDPSDRTARSYGATGLPETYFIDARGRVVGHVIGQITPEQLMAGVEAARSGRLLGARAGGERRTSN